MAEPGEGYLVQLNCAQKTTYLYPFPKYYCQESLILTPEAPEEAAKEGERAAEEAEAGSGPVVESREVKVEGEEVREQGQEQATEACAEPVLT